MNKEQLARVEAIAMDMWDPYVASTHEHLPEADLKIVYDKYHIAAHLAKAVDQVRRAAGDERLVGTKYAWLRHPASFAEDAWRQFRALRESDLKTARAWVLKETAMRLFDYRREQAARTFFALWSGWASCSRLEPMVAVARMLTARLENIPTYLKHRITNAVSEGLNSKIQWVKATARGFRNQQNFINTICFHCGGLDLAPAHQKPGRAQKGRPFVGLVSSPGRNILAHNVTVAPYRRGLFGLQDVYSRSKSPMPIFYQEAARMRTYRLESAIPVEWTDTLDSRRLGLKSLKIGTVLDTPPEIIRSVIGLDSDLARVRVDGRDGFVPADRLKIALPGLHE